MTMEDLEESQKELRDVLSQIDSVVRSRVQKMRLAGPLSAKLGLPTKAGQPPISFLSRLLGLLGIGRK